MNDSKSHLPPTATPAWLTRREAAQFLKLGESTLAKLFVSGDGPPAIKIGRSVRYSEVDLNAWMGSRRRRSTSDNGSAEVG
ncbi:helix-turn-helix domain-containing protein [Bradyrhizobium sp. SZCCHNR2028]|uniref:helix-turn-helix transcriptional regulator n=1 Tax=Bradyrhizobium sp. SZCCHNR2028 TaxID=3057382 RepID=UPI0028EB608B|nr:helix-turn-helix domain-containing protein [Bradyrhizobium sp. SZCCHNR2028]